MDASLKQRLVGAVVLVALAVIFLPMLVNGPAPDSGVSDVPLDVPAEPKAPAGMVTRDLPLVAPGDAPDGGAVGMPATVPDAAQPAQDAAATPFPAVAAGDYAVSFGSYGSADDADKVIAALAKAQLPGYRESVELNGRKAERVRIGPFADRALAESARLRAGDVRDDIQAKVVVLDADAAQPAAARPEPAKPQPVAAKPAPRQEPKPAPKPEPKPEPKPAPKPAAPAPAPAPVAPVARPEPPVARPANPANTGFVVQMGAFADALAATALRDKLRGMGFNTFTDTVPGEKGTLTRVRVGPVVSRAEADALKAQLRARAGMDGSVRTHP